MDADGRALKRVLSLMEGIALTSPVYQDILTDLFIKRCFEPAILHSRVEFLSFPGREAAFFTTVRPSRPLAWKCAPDPEDWTARGPLLWIVDVGATPGVHAGTLRRAMMDRALQRGLVTPGERVLFWRSTGRLGWITAR